MAAETLLKMVTNHGKDNVDTCTALCCVRAAACVIPDDDSGGIRDLKCHLSSCQIVRLITVWVCIYCSLNNNAWWSKFLVNTHRRNIEQVQFNKRKSCNKGKWKKLILEQTKKQKFYVHATSWYVKTPELPRSYKDIKYYVYEICRKIRS